MTDKFYYFDGGEWVDEDGNRASWDKHSDALQSLFDPQYDGESTFAYLLRTGGMGKSRLLG
jgi:hypothetical protein